jgi:hypothetical protein
MLRPLCEKKMSEAGDPFVSFEFVPSQRRAAGCGRQPAGSDTE